MADLIVSFQGMDADKGHLQAFSGLESISGIARALTIVAHYAATGDVRRRYPFSKDVQFFLEGTEEGSFNFRLKLIIAAAAASPLAISLSYSAIYDIAKTVLMRCVGDEPSQISSEAKQLDRERGGDLSALVEAVEPALKNGHYGIGNTTKSITIREETTRTVIVKFDSSSKEYLMQEVPGDDDVQQVSISALNANDLAGRAYFLDLQRTVPFRVDKDAHPETMAVLSAFLDAYVNKDPAPVQLSFERIESSDGRLKRIVIYGAKNVAGSK